MRPERFKDERGSVLMMTFGIMLGIVAFSLVLFDIYAVYMGRRVAQNAADAAALGALEGLRKAADEAIVTEADRRFQSRLQLISAETSAQVSTWEHQRRTDLTRQLEREREAACPPSPESPPPPDTSAPEPCPDHAGIAEEVDRMVGEDRPNVADRIYQSVIRTRIRHADLRSAILQGRTPEAIWLVEEFLTAQDLSCVVRTVAVEHKTTWETTGGYFAAVNGGEYPAFEFPYDGRTAIGVKVPVRLRLLVFDRLVPEHLRHVHAEAAVQINRFGPLPLDVRASC